MPVEIVDASDKMRVGLRGLRAGPQVRTSRTKTMKIKVNTVNRRET